MPDDELRNAVHAIVARLQADFEAHLARIDEQHTAAREDIRRETEAAVHARATDEWSAKIDAVRQEWQTRLQAELAESATQAEQRLAAETQRVRSDVEQAALESTNRLRQEMEQATVEATVRVRQEMDQAALLSTERLRAELEESSAQSTIQLRQQMEEALTAERARAGAELESERAKVVAELEAERSRAQEAIERERARAQEEINNLRTHTNEELTAARAKARDELNEESSRLAAEVEAERQSARQLTAALEETQTALRDTRSAMESATSALDQAQTALAAEQQARETAIADIAALRAASQEAAATEVRAEERHTRLAVVDGLLAAVRSVAEARSLTDTLSALSAAAASMAPRVALFIVNDRQGHRELQGWRASGFADPSPALLRLPADDGGLLATASASRNPLTNTTVSAPDFAGLPGNRAALAVPITVGGKSVAILYADDGVEDETESPASWPEAVQILGAHASVCLSHITAVRTAQAMRANTPSPNRASSPPEDDSSARRYARLLVSEIKLYNETAVRTGREKRDLLHRLRPEIERARRLYEERVSPSIAGRSAYFQEELVHTLADGDPALLGSS